MKKTILTLTFLVTAFVGFAQLSSVRISKSGSGQPLYLVDGLQISPENIDKINPKDIASINVLKNENATAAYGEKGKNGVVQISMKKDANMLEIIKLTKVESSFTTDNLKSTKNICYFIGNTQIPTAEAIKPEYIEKVEVLKGEAAKAYNADCADGVVVITLKK